MISRSRKLLFLRFSELNCKYPWGHRRLNAAEHLPRAWAYIVLLDPREPVQAPVNQKWYSQDWTVLLLVSDRQPDIVFRLVDLLVSRTQKTSTKPTLRCSNSNLV